MGARATMAAESSPPKIRAALSVLTVVVLAVYNAPCVSAAGGDGGKGGSGKQCGYTTSSSSSADNAIFVVASPYFFPPSLFAEVFGMGGEIMGLLLETSPYIWEEKE